jgi:hypothetical protein
MSLLNVIGYGWEIAERVKTTASVPKRRKKE